MTKEVLKQALEALEKTNRFILYGTHNEPIGQIAEQGIAAITAIKEALAQPEQEQETIYLFRRKGQDDFVTCNQERYNEFSDHRLFEVKTLYT